MSNDIINVLVVVDGVALADKYKGDKGTESNPTRISRDDNKYISLIGSADHVVSEQGHENLTIKGEVNQVINWRSTTLMVDSVYSVSLQEFKKAGGDTLITGPDHIIPSHEVPYWEGTIIREGQETYDWVFKLTSRHNVATEYYLSWDPYISVRRYGE